jgi:hypothetical protein
MVEIAFYIGKKRLYNKLLSLIMPVTHVELVVNNLCYSSSSMDGGVRRKSIDINNGNWEVKHIECENESEIIHFYQMTKKRKYDHVAAVLNHLIQLCIDVFKKRYTCSEWCILAYNKANNTNINPNITLTEMYEIFKAKK